MARAWAKIRDEAIAGGFLEAGKVKQAENVLAAQVRAYRLTEVRKAQGATQQSVSAAMGISQSRVSRIERGELPQTEVGTLSAYVEALGGRLRVIAEFDDASLTLT